MMANSVIDGLNGITMSIVYLTLQISLLLLIVCVTYDRKRGIIDNIKFVWRRRSVYGTVLVQLFDQASDIGVLILWWQYADDENDSNSDFDVPHVDMQLMASLSLASLITSRVVSSLIVLLTVQYTNKFEKYLDALLCLLEFYVIKQVWISHRYGNSNKFLADINSDTATAVSTNATNDKNTKETETSNNGSNNGSNNDDIEPTAELRSTKWVEAIFESFPQTLLQSVFVIRTFDTDFDIKNIERIFFNFSSKVCQTTTTPHFFLLNCFCFSRLSWHKEIKRKQRQK